MLVSKDFLTWLLIGWRLCCQPIRCQVWKYLLNNQVVADSNFKYVLEIKDVPKFKDARTKFKYDCNPRLLSSYCKITFENLRLR